MLDFKSLTSAALVLAGLELVYMIRNSQFTLELRPFQQFAGLAGKTAHHFQ